jgi:cysteinyl-tRNA synthetase
MEEFVPQVGRTVTWYMCGPTVYSDSHLGHAKTYLCFDIIRKIMERHFKYDVRMVMNITNIDDKIIKHSQEQKRDFFEFGKFWEKDFFNVMGRLDVDLPDVITRVTEFIPEIIEFIEQIIANGYAYESNGSVYFNVHEYVKGGFEYPILKKGQQCEVVEDVNEVSEDTTEVTGKCYWEDMLLTSREKQVCVREEKQGRLRIMEKRETWRTKVAVSMGRRTTRMAHRMFCNGGSRFQRKEN